jgi:hypothetical protein
MTNFTQWKKWAANEQRYRNGGRREEKGQKIRLGNHFHRGESEATKKTDLKRTLPGRWLTPAVLATQGAEIGRIVVRSQPEQTVYETLSQKNPSQNRVGGVAQVVQRLPSKPEALTSSHSIIEKNLKDEILNCKTFQICR